ncbi:MAG: alpha/beta hydrolase [Acidobacteria bacterium]|nr:MAG: alpha/beta hydrolase [Acidobacteriota bacterium]PYQ25336.1 MAG: alpha/beta hydrolase [Acidobacteriota bacterium]
MAQNESFDLAGPAGRLECILMTPDGPAVAAAVVCHAHPLQGGVMHFKVVFRAAKALQQQGLAVLRFNFRGVGRSEGAHDQGRGEQDDVRAALAEMQRRFPRLPLIAGGFSFGASMALQVGCAAGAASALFALGLPARMILDLGFLEACRAPRLFVQGEADPFGDGDFMRRLMERLPEPRTLVVVPGADHFFGGHLEELQDALAAWAAARPWATAIAEPR